MDPSSPELDALVVLGCKVNDGAPSAALLRRLERARASLSERSAPLVVMSGGKTWDGRSEADVMAAWWLANASSAPPASETAQLLLEDRSLTTRENAFHTARLLRVRTIRRIGLVTCDFHMGRARRLFSSQGFEVVPLPAKAQRPFSEQVRLTAREWLAGLLGSFENTPR